MDMNQNRRAPLECQTMQELRLSIDDLDRELVSLLAQRAAYIDRAAALKLENGWPARIPDRVTQVIENAMQQARGKGLDPQLVQELWTAIVEWSIAREDKVLDDARTSD